MHAPTTESTTDQSPAPGGRRYRRVVGLAVAAYVLALSVAVLAVPVGLVVAFDQPVPAALKTTAVAVGLGYAPLALLALSEWLLVADA